MTQTGFVVAPALDVLEGRCVRLREGVRERVSVEGGDPVEAARRFAAEGARLLHLVDLDGAFAGSPTPGLVERVVGAVDVPVQVGGGLRSLDTVRHALDAGAARAIVGTAAAASPEFLREVAPLGERVVVAIDVKDARVATDGWTAAVELTAGELARRCAEAGIARLLVTNTRRDGSLQGPDTELLGEVLSAGLPVLAAGGIATLDDLRALKALGCEGAIAGSAIWLGRFTLTEALAAV